MIREYFFRGQRVDTKEWVYGDLIHNDKTHFPMTLIGSITMSKNKYTNELELDGYCLYEVVPETVGQYTGLTDKNGKTIFEGDVLLESNKKHIVIFRDGSFSYMNVNNTDYWTSFDDCTYGKDGECFEVIDNIHDKEGGAE